MPIKKKVACLLRSKMTKGVSIRSHALDTRIEDVETKHKIIFKKKWCRTKISELKNRSKNYSPSECKGVT